MQTMATARRAARRSFGSIKQQRSGRYQASYVGPDDARHTAPTTFTTKLDAEGWLNDERRRVEWGDWTTPASREAARQAARAQHTVTSYAETWLPARVNSRGKPLADKTRSEYRRYLERLILPALGDLSLTDVTPATIKSWYDRLNRQTVRMNWNAYVLLKSIFASAVDDELIERNPCRLKIKTPQRADGIGEPLTVVELAQLTEALPERLRLMVELAAWCALRFGEVAELRRSDVDTDKGIIRVQRAVQWIDGIKTVSTPKADSQGIVALPPHLSDLIVAHLRDHAQGGADGLLFPTAKGEQYRAPTFHKTYWRPARERVGKPDLRFHDLRHTGATLAAISGATLAEQMKRLRHKTASAALRYQHAAQDSDARIARALSDMARA